MRIYRSMKMIAFNVTGRDYGELLKLLKRLYPNHKYEGGELINKRYFLKYNLSENEYIRFFRILNGEV